MRNTLNLVAPLAAGLVFGLGLIAAGMTDPAKVLAFLDLAGTWDPSLALVMGGAIAVALVPFAWAKRHREPSSVSLCSGRPRVPSMLGCWAAAPCSASAGAWRACARARPWWPWPQGWKGCGSSCSPCWPACWRWTLSMPAAERPVDLIFRQLADATSST